jgi:hypothetical protein
MALLDQGSRDASVRVLIDELHHAATEAGWDGFHRMARVLEDCSRDLSRQLDGVRVDGGRCGERQHVEHARQSLAMWRALRDW